MTRRRLQLFPSNISFKTRLARPCKYSCTYCCATVLSRGSWNASMARAMSSVMPPEADMGVRVKRQPYKTRPCKFFPLGLCTRGRECTFVHPTDRLPDNKMGSPYLMAGAGGPFSLETLGPAGLQGKMVLIPAAQLAQLNAQKKYKTEICKFFSEKKCLKGSACSFIHPGSDPSVPYRVKQCVFFQRGCCNRGSDCTFRHDGPLESNAQGGTSSQESQSPLSPDNQPITGQDSPAYTQSGVVDVLPQPPVQSPPQAAALLKAGQPHHLHHHHRLQPAVGQPQQTAAEQEHRR
eukprot:g60296.t1